ncbi:MAG: ABC transporter ATP-binding protein [Clostridiales bacterium]|jgi:ABC-type multidrug transport system ATPase subunit|nr:ABC transporter ATP-binding protein [Clostridiales bacterium]
MKIIELEKHFGQFSLKVGGLYIEPGGIFGLIGPNGSGKSTFMKIMAGIMEPDNGKIDYEGLNYRDMTMVSRKPYFLHDTVYNNLIYPLRLRKIKPAPDLVDYFLSLAGLKQRQYAPSLSSGEQQKLALARAMIFSPKLIFIDEAFSNLDMESVSVFERVILERQKIAPATWVIISHQLSHIERLCAHAGFMYGGRLEAVGTIKEIFQNPENPLLKKYLQYMSF